MSLSLKKRKMHIKLICSLWIYKIKILLKTRRNVFFSLCRKRCFCNPVFLFVFCKFLDKFCFSAACLTHNRNVSFLFSIVAVFTIHRPSSIKSLLFLIIRCLLFKNFLFRSIKSSRMRLWVSHHILLIFCFASALYFLSLAIPLFYPKNISQFFDRSLF